MRSLAFIASFSVMKPSPALYLTRNFDKNLALETALGGAEPSVFFFLSQYRAISTRDFLSTFVAKVRWMSEFALRPNGTARGPFGQDLYVFKYRCLMTLRTASGVMDLLMSLFDGLTTTAYFVGGAFGFLGFCAEPKGTATSRQPAAASKTRRVDLVRAFMELGT